MNDSTRLAVQPEVVEFVVRVRARLGDLTEEEREELLGGLEADLSERLAEGGSDGLGDPVAYAAELRAAAGLDVGGRRSRPPGPPLHEQADQLLDDAAQRWAALVSEHEWAAQVWDTVSAMRPVWWALRAWAAVQLLDWMLGPTEYATVVPALGAPLVGPVVLLAAVWASVQLGRGRLWPGVLSPLRTWVRVGLLALNVFALVMLGALTAHFPDPWTSHDLANGALYADSTPPEGPGLRNDGHFVRNVFAYDADGKPLTGVQLYDAKGRPLAVTGDRYYRSYQVEGSTVWTYPWFNGAQPLLNVFPLPTRGRGFVASSAKAWASSRPPAVPAGPLAVVPPVSLPTPGSAATPTPMPTPTAGPSAGPTAGARTPSAHPTADSEKRPRR